MLGIVFSRGVLGHGTHWGTWKHFSSSYHCATYTGVEGETEVEVDREDEAASGVKRAGGGVNDSAAGASVDAVTCDVIVSGSVKRNLKR